MLRSGPVYPESLVVKADGSLKNVFVYVSKGLEGKTFPTPSEPVVLYTPRTPPAPVRVAANGGNMGGGFIEFLFGGEGRGQGQGQGQVYYPQREPMYQQQPSYYDQRRLPPMGDPQMQGMQEQAVDPRMRPFDPKFEKQMVEYSGREGAGTIVVDTPNKFLYLVEGNGKAMP